MIVVLLIFIALVLLNPGHGHHLESQHPTKTTVTKHDGTHSVIIEKETADGHIYRETARGIIIAPRRCGSKRSNASSGLHSKQCDEHWDAQP